jgi:hypothetical protein
MTPHEGQFERKYQSPVIDDFGPITEHTFTRAGGQGPKMGDWIACALDKFGEYSCTSHLS